jgi:hypothetical protein
MLLTFLLIVTLHLSLMFLYDVILNIFLRTVLQMQVLTSRFFSLGPYFLPEGTENLVTAKSLNLGNISNEFIQINFKFKQILA